jgi:hypothetical protein
MKFVSELFPILTDNVHSGEESVIISHEPMAVAASVTKPATDLQPSATPLQQDPDQPA